MASKLDKWNELTAKEDNMLEERGNRQKKKENKEAVEAVGTDNAESLKKKNNETVPPSSKTEQKDENKSQKEEGSKEPAADTKSGKESQEEKQPEKKETEKKKNYKSNSKTYGKVPSMYTRGNIDFDRALSIRMAKDTHRAIKMASDDINYSASNYMVMAVDAILDIGDYFEKVYAEAEENKVSMGTVIKEALKEYYTKKEN